MKKVVMVMLCIAVFIGFSGSGARDIRAQRQIVIVKGDPPLEYSGEVIKKELLLKAKTVSDGYLLPGNGVEKYNLKGERIWEKTYPFIKGEEYSYIEIFPYIDDSFVICFDVMTYHKDDGTLRTGSPILARCDKDGNLLWQIHYEGFHEEFDDAALGKVFFMDNGNIVTIGHTRIGEAKETGTLGIDDIYLSLIDKNGNLLNEKYYGGTDFDSFCEADYVDGVGLITLIRTQSTNGTFSASKDGYPENVLMLIDENLDIKWHKHVGDAFFFEPMEVTNDAIYLLDVDNKYSIVEFDGTVTYSEILYEEDTDTHLVGKSKYGLLIQSADELVFYNDKLAGLRLKCDLDLEHADKIIDSQNGFIIVSTKITGELPISPYLTYSHFPRYSTEIVYSKYDEKGGLIWRISYDNTPEAYYY